MRRLCTQAKQPGEEVQTFEETHSSAVWVSEQEGPWSQERQWAGYLVIWL